jgi:hypothetical protein
MLVESDRVAGHTPALLIRDDENFDPLRASFTVWSEADLLADTRRYAGPTIRSFGKFEKTALQPRMADRTDAGRHGPQRVGLPEESAESGTSHAR